MWLLIPFILVPLIEIGLFIQVGGAIGLLPTLVIVVVTAIIGTILMRAQGLATLAELQRRLDTGKNPTDTIAHGALILVAGVLLLTPGFFTDAVGFSLLLPPVRAFVIARGAARLASRINVQSAGMGQQGPGRPASGDVIDGEYTPVPENPDAPPGTSGWTRRE